MQVGLIGKSQNLKAGFMIKLHRAFALAIFAVMANLLTGTAYSCSCRPLSPAEHVDRTEFIFRGEVVDKRSTAGLLNPLSRGERVVFEVRKSWKGPELKKMVVHVGSTSSAACGVDFKLGWTGIVFAQADENGEPATNLCLMLQPETSDGSPDYKDLLPGYSQPD